MLNDRPDVGAVASTETVPFDLVLRLGRHIRPGHDNHDSARLPERGQVYFAS